MGNRIDHLFQEWHRLGGAVLLRETDPAISLRACEEVIAESTAHCRASGRLTWVVLDWLICHIDEIGSEALQEETVASGDLSVLGVLCDAAYQRSPNLKFAYIMRGCVPCREVVPFFHRVARSPLASRLARENGIDVFLRWNCLCSELCYLSEGKTQLAEASGSRGN